MVDQNQAHQPQTKIIREHTISGLSTVSAMSHLSKMSTINGISTLNDLKAISTGTTSPAIRSAINQHETKIEMSDADKIVEREPDGTRKIKYLATGTMKIVETSGVMTIKFQNGDVKTIFPEGFDSEHRKDVYYYFDSKTTETNFYKTSKKSHIVQFQDGQIEHHFKNSDKKIFYPDNSTSFITNNGLTELTENPNGIKVYTKFTDQNQNVILEKKLIFPDGTIEEHNKDFRRRTFPDGTVKTIFEDGHQETRYKNGRLRIKDKNKNVIIDRIMEQQAF